MRIRDPRSPAPPARTALPEPPPGPVPDEDDAAAARPPAMVEAGEVEDPAEIEPVAPAPPSAIEMALLSTVETIERLIAVLDRETRAVADMDVDGGAALQPEKAALTEAYAMQIKDLGGRGEELATLDEAALEPLAEIRARLFAALEANLHTLANGRDATQRIVDLVTETVSNAAASVQGYGKAGRPPARSGSRCVSVSLDGKF